MKNRPTPAVEKPTMLDIAWAAGIFEGEGHVSVSGTSLKVAVTQKDDWLPCRLRDLFGGLIYKHKARPINEWVVSGPRARGFIFTIFAFLSPRRKEQTRKALNGSAKCISRSERLRQLRRKGTIWQRSS